jgi:lipoyl(octanoyl) transferase
MEPAVVHRPPPASLPVAVRALGMTDYSTSLERMRGVTRTRDPASVDEIWLTEHPPVYTLGLAGRREHIIEPGDVPVVESDRGGQVTYHGPGQLVVYLLVDLARRGFKVREFVGLIEAAVIAVLADIGIAGHRRAGMPGVYVDGAKIAALGLKVSRGCCYHGLSLNVDVDLEPFARIDPCGYRDLAVTRIADLRPQAGAAHVADRLVAQLISRIAPPAGP